MWISRLNRELMILLPKHSDVSALGDYCAISPIHIFAKLVDRNQSDFNSEALHSQQFYGC